MQKIEICIANISYCTINLVLHNKLIFETSESFYKYCVNKLNSFLNHIYVSHMQKYDMLEGNNSFR